MPTPNVASPIVVTPGILLSIQIPDILDSVRYTVTANRAVRISQGCLSNVSGAAVLVGLSVIPAGGAVDGTHKVIPYGFSIGAGDMLPLKDYLGDAMLGDGDEIAVHASVANAINVLITGVVTQ